MQLSAFRRLISRLILHAEVHVASYPQIQERVRQRAGFTPETCWIAHVKEIHGLPLRKAWNRRSERVRPCPPEKRGAIEEAFRYLGMLPQTTAPQ